VRRGLVGFGGHWVIWTSDGRFGRRLVWNAGGLMGRCFVFGYREPTPRSSGRVDVFMGGTRWTKHPTSSQHVWAWLFQMKQRGRTAQQGCV
jgi:hypothetical protein